MAHTFEVTTRWSGGLRGELVPAGVEKTVPFAVPVEFGGPGGEWTPEHFLAAAVSSCILATFLTVARMSKLELAACSSTVRCTLEKTPDGLRFHEITVSPRVTVQAQKDVDRARRLLEKAERLCPVSNALEVRVVLEPAVDALA